MIKFAKISDAALGRVDVFLGRDTKSAAALGFAPLDVTKVDDQWFLTECAQGEEFEQYVGASRAAARACEIRSRLCALDSASIRSIRALCALAPAFVFPSLANEISAENTSGSASAAGSAVGDGVDASDDASSSAAGEALEDSSGTSDVSGTSASSAASSETGGTDLDDTEADDAVLVELNYLAAYEQEAALLREELDRLE